MGASFKSRKRSAINLRGYLMNKFYKNLKYVGVLYPVGLLVSVEHYQYEIHSAWAAYALCCVAFMSPLAISVIQDD